VNYSTIEIFSEATKRFSKERQRGTSFTFQEDIIVTVEGA
jgi:hypothetical protein